MCIRATIKPTKFHQNKQFALKLRLNKQTCLVTATQIQFCSTVAAAHSSDENSQLTQNSNNNDFTKPALTLINILH